MACTPLNIQNGLFVPSVWSTALSTGFNGGTVTYTPGGPSPGIVVQKGSQSVFHAQLGNQTLKYMVLGNEYVLILAVDTGAGPSTRNVSLVNFATSSEVNVLTVLASSNAVPLPFVAGSPGNASVFLAFGEDGTQLTSVAIYRSNDGAALCSLGAPIMATGQTTAEATASDLIIHYSTGGTSQNKICPRPAGKCSVTPASQTFPDVYVGGCPFTPPTKLFSIKNVGSDCLTINSITDAAPFTNHSTSKPLPASLGPNETVDVTVAFNPTAPASFPSTALPVIRAPANGDSQLVCKGNALAAQFKIAFSATTLSFGKVQVGGPPKQLQLTITNTGSRPLPVIVPPLNASGFSCAGFNGTLNCGQSQPIAIVFTPPAEGPASAVLNISSSAPSSPQPISLVGEGCVPNAVIVVPPAAPIDFGQVQRGFRTVRIFEVQNTGDGPLTFTGTIGGSDAALFGLPEPQGSVTDPPATRTYSVLPLSPCGPGAAGSGKTIVAVSFFANDPPKIAAATLILSGHNATNFPAAQTWVFPLSAEITPPVALDVVSVVDHSGSMNDPLGSRVKIDAAVSASQLLVQLLRPDLDDRFALLRFNERPEVIVGMSAVSTTIAPTQADLLQDVQTKLPPAIGATAIAGGAITGGREITDKPRAAPPPMLTRALVVLTDGQENTGFEDPAGSGNWLSITGGEMDKPPPPGGTASPGRVNTSSMPRPAGVSIYAIGIGADTDISPSQLTALSGPNTVFRVNQDLTGTKYFQLEKYYTQIFMDIANFSSVSDPMFWIGPGVTQEIEFDVLRGDVDALVVVYDWQGMRLPFFCLSPAGEVIDPSSVPVGYQFRSGVTRDTRFVEFKLPLNEPHRYAGRWKVLIEHPGRVCFGIPPKKSRKRGFLPEKCRQHKQPILYGIAIGVGSNFRMIPYVTPAPVYVGDPILLTAVVTEAGLAVTGCVVTVEATAPDGSTEILQLVDDGQHADGEAADGEYASYYRHTYNDGTYHFAFKATGTSRDGEPAVREAVRDKPVLRRELEDPGRADRDGRRDAAECCEELKKAIHEQTDLLREVLQTKTT
jgi:hypothetical protein